MSSNYNEYGRCRLSHNRIKDKGAGPGESFSSVSRNSPTHTHTTSRSPVTTCLGQRIVEREPLSNISPDRSVYSRSRHRNKVSPCQSTHSGSWHTSSNYNKHDHHDSKLSRRRSHIREAGESLLNMLRNSPTPVSRHLGGRAVVGEPLSKFLRDRTVRTSSRHRSSVSPYQSTHSSRRHSSNVSPDRSSRSLSWDGSVVSEPFSSDLEGNLSPWQKRQNELNLEQTNDKNRANTGREIDFVNVRDNSVNCCTYREDVSEGDIHGRQPTVGAVASRRGNMADDQLTKTAAVLANNTQRQRQCSVCNLDFTDRRVKIG